MRPPSLRRSLLALLALGELLVIGIAAPPAEALDGWNQLPNGPRAGFSKRHDDLWFINPNRGWVVNGDGEVWRTPDGGNTWSLTAYTGTYNRCVGFLGPQHGFIGALYQTNEDALLETFDGGTTWLPVSLPEPKPRGLCGMQVVDAQTICAVGAYYGFPCFIRTTDSGVTWTVKDMSPWCGALVDTWWFNPQVGIAVGSTAPGSTRRTVILRTTDGGDNWSVQWTGPRDMELCWKISFVDANVGFVSIENLAQVGSSYLLKTRDGGETWSELLFDLGYRNCQGIGFVTEYYGWLGGWNIGTYVTRSGGNSWQAASFGYHVNRIRFLSPSLGYACGRDIYKYSPDVAGVGVESPPPVSFLAQNRPNPFAARTEIEYEVASPGPVSLRVFDPAGRQVRELFAGTREAGHFTERFDAAGLAAGTYYYRLQTADGTETRKLQIVR